jgi:hypothetical protein
LRDRDVRALMAALTEALLFRQDRILLSSQYEIEKGNCRKVH